MTQKSASPYFDNWIRFVKSSWAEAFAEKNFTVWFVGNFSACLITYLAISQWLIANRLRPGEMLYDPVIHHLPAIDFSIPLFVLTYSVIFAFLPYILSRPRIFIYACHGFLALFALRALFIYLLPLHPPEGVIPLRDPFTDNVIGFKGQVLNDLFFSGHLGDISFFLFCSQNKTLRTFITCAAFLIGVLLVWQHVHYTADVIASPFFAYCCYSIFTRRQQQGF